MRKFFISCLLIFGWGVITFAQSPQDIDRLNDAAELMLNQNPAQSLDTAAKTRSAAEKIQYRKGAAKAIAIMGIANFKVDDYAKAKALLNEAVAISIGIRDTSDLAFCKYWLGNVELNQGRYSNALDLFQTAYTLAEKTGDKKNIARSLDGKASIYEALNDDAKALELYKQDLAVAKKANFKAWYPGVLLSLGNLAYNRGEIDEAISDYNEAIKGSDEAGNLNNKAGCYQQLAEIYIGKKDFKEAMKYVQLAMALFQQTGSESSFSHSRLLMSEIFLNNKDYSSAIEAAMMSLEEGRDTHETELQESAAEILYYAWLKKGDKAKALNYHILFHDLSVANQKEELTKKVAQMEMTANFEKEREITKLQQGKRDAEMNARLERQNLVKKFSFICIFLLAVIAGLAIFAFTQNRKDSMLIASEKKKTDILLMNILPGEIVSELKKIEYKADNLSTVLFADVIGAGAGHDQVPPGTESIHDSYFRAFDLVIARHKLEKIKTAGDTYLCVGSLPLPDKENAVNVVSAALEMRQYIAQAKKERQQKGTAFLEISIGIHTGPLIAGIVGIRKFSYDIWGDTVNIATRMEQRGEEGQINISGATYDLIKDQFICTHRGEVDARKKEKKEKIDMYFVEGASTPSVQS